MAKAEQSINFRRSSSWVHTWLGLFFGWLLFMVFITGTLSVFRTEIGAWLQPESLAVNASDEVLASRQAVAFLEQQGPASQWFIELPDRSPAVQLRWFSLDEKVTKRGGQRAQLDPSNGQPIKTRDSRFMDFLYRMHFELYRLPRNQARWLVGIATTAMFIALITGVIIHRRIFSDFFSFRPRKGQRSWLDLHNLVSVLALPFHLMITFSGLLLLMYLLIPWGVQAAFDGDWQQFMKASGGRGGGQVVTQRLTPSSTSSLNADVDSQLSMLMTIAEQRWPNGVEQIRVLDPQGQPSFELRQYGANSLVNRASGESITYHSQTRELTVSYRPTDSISFAKKTYNVLSAWHLMRFAEPLQRWLYFVCGIAGSLMVASGLMLWLKRRQLPYLNNDKTVLPTHLRWVGTLNLSAIMGLMAAIAAAAMANRLLPATLSSRLDWEITIFFMFWAFTMGYSWLRHHWFYAPQKSWRELLILNVSLYLLVALLDLLLIWPTVSLNSNGGTILLTIDLMLLCFVLAFWRTQRWLTKQQNIINKAKTPHRQHREARQ